MPRNLNTDLKTAMSLGLVTPVLFVRIEFRTQTMRAWTGVGDLVVDGNTYKGVGSFGKMGNITESIDVRADGTSVTLSGIDPILLQECMTDIQLGAPASLAFGLVSNGVIIGAPYTLFVGTVDVPTVSVGVETLSITLALESKMVDLSRPSLDRYTTGSQRIKYPTDSSFGWVESLNDISLVWGS